MAAPLAQGEAQQGLAQARSTDSSKGLWALHLDGQRLWGWLSTGVVQARCASWPALRGRSGTSAKPGAAKCWPETVTDQAFGLHVLASVRQESDALAAHAPRNGFARCDLAQGAPHVRPLGRLVYSGLP